MKGVAKLRPSAPKSVPRIARDTMTRAGGSVPVRF
jgi:hypothetical protein